MAKSENGWNTLDGSSLDKKPFPGTKVVPVPGVRKGDVAIVLHEVGRRFNKEVAKLYNPGCWGYAAPIPIPGTKVISNHGSGTAVDFNAPSFPWKQKTMSKKQRAACRKIVKDMGGVVRWGGDYTTFVDEMHFEINSGAKEVKKQADKIRSKEEDMVTVQQIYHIVRAVNGRTATQEELKKYVGKQTYAEFFTRASSWKSAKNARKKAEEGKLDTVEHLLDVYQTKEMEKK